MYRDVCCFCCWQIAASYVDKVCIYEPVPLPEQRSSHVSDMLSKNCYNFLFLGKGASYSSGVIEKRDFSGFRTLRIRHLRKWGKHYYILLFSPLLPFHWPQNTWPWMTLNGLNGHFTLYVHYYERPLIHYLLLVYSRSLVCLLHVMWPAHKCGKRSIANGDPQSGRIFGISGKSADLPWTLKK